MNWFRTILDGLAISAVFICCVAAFWILKPHSFIVMFPKSLQKKTGNRLHADGVKDDPFYEPKNELLKLGLPEHLFLWPVLYCPILGFIAAGIGMLIR